MLRIFGKPFVDATSLIGQLIALVQTQKFSSFNDKGKKEITDALVSWPPKKRQLAKVEPGP